MPSNRLERVKGPEVMLSKNNEDPPPPFIEGIRARRHLQVRGSPSGADGEGDLPPYRTQDPGTGKLMRGLESEPLPMYKPKQDQEVETRKEELPVYPSSKAAGSTNSTALARKKMTIAIDSSPPPYHRDLQVRGSPSGADREGDLPPNRPRAPGAGKLMRRLESEPLPMYRPKQDQEVETRKEELPAKAAASTNSTALANKKMTRATDSSPPPYNKNSKVAWQDDQKPKVTDALPQYKARIARNDNSGSFKLKSQSLANGNGATEPLDGSSASPKGKRSPPQRERDSSFDQETKLLKSSKDKKEMTTKKPDGFSEAGQAEERSDGEAQSNRVEVPVTRRNVEEKRGGIAKEGNARKGKQEASAKQGKSGREVESFGQISSSPETIEHAGIKKNKKVDKWVERAKREQEVEEDEMDPSVESSQEESRLPQESLTRQKTKATRQRTEHGASLRDTDSPLTRVTGVNHMTERQSLARKGLSTGKRKGDKLPQQVKEQPETVKDRPRPQQREKTSSASLQPTSGNKTIGKSKHDSSAQPTKAGFLSVVGVTVASVSTPREPRDEQRMPSKLKKSRRRKSKNVRRTLQLMMRDMDKEYERALEEQQRKKETYEAQLQQLSEGLESAEEANRKRTDADRELLKLALKRRQELNTLIYNTKRLEVSLQRKREKLLSEYRLKKMEAIVKGTSGKQMKQGKRKVDSGEESSSASSSRSSGSSAESEAESEEAASDSNSRRRKMNGSESGNSERDSSDEEERSHSSRRKAR